MTLNRKNIVVPILLMFSLFNCKEEFIIETQDFESILVVEATITNELKHQEVKLSRTYLLEGSEQVFENNAAVSVVDSSGNRFNFSQNSEGVYISDVAFEALPDFIYNLIVETNNGKQFISLDEQLTSIAQIDNLYPEYTNSETDGENITVFVDSDNSNTNAKLFRYEFEETYKIIAPHHSDFDAEIVNYDAVLFTYDVLVTPREQEERVCFTTKANTEIILKNTSDLNESLISRFPIRKINVDNSMLITRYSINVRQFSQTLEAYKYYETLKNLENNGNILSESQPGYIQGNIFSANGSERVVGFFEVASVSSKRIYFNYQDFEIVEPPFFYECELLLLDYLDNLGPHPYFGDGDINERVLLQTKIDLNNYKHVSGETGGQTYEIVSPECGDCTTFSSNIQPNFWQD